MMYIKGAGMTKFGISDKSSHQLAYDAAQEALDDAGISFSEIDAVVCSSIEWFFSLEKQRHFESMLSSIFKTHKPIVRIPAACGSSGAGLWFAQQQDFDNVLVVGAEKLMTCKSEAITEEFMMAAESKWEQTEGFNFPAQNAMVAQEYMLKYPETTHDHLSLIAFKNHNNAYSNPKAKFYNTKISLEKIRSSPLVCSPLRVFDCSVSADGGSAVVLSKDKADIKIIGAGLSTDYMSTFEREDNTSWNASVTSAGTAYKQAGIDHSDIDIAEIHDAFSIVELIAYEDLGFSKKGTAYKKIEDGYF